MACAPLGARYMSRVGRMPVKVPPSVSVRVERIDVDTLPPFKPFSPKRFKYAWRNRPCAEGFAAFGEPSRVIVEGPLGTLELPVHSFISVAVDAEAGTVDVTPQDGGCKLGKTLWGTTRGYLAAAVRGVTQGFRKDLELHGVGFKARVSPVATAVAPAGERSAVQKRLGVEQYGQQVLRMHPGPPLRKGAALSGSVIYAGAGGSHHGARRGPFSTGKARSVLPDARLGLPGCAEEGEALMLRIGFAHEVRIDFPPHLTVTTPTPTTISIFGIDRQQVGLAASRVRLLRKPEVYKGKGIRYAGEVVRLKQGKK